jgi:hypothetical protein
METQMKQNRGHIYFQNFLLILSLAFSLFAWPNTASAQASNWEVPQWIPGLVDTSPSQVPVFLADKSGNLHVFHSQWVNGVFTVVYSQWIVGVGWTKPVDILIPPVEQARLKGAVLDSNDEVHLIFWDGNEFFANIYYTHASLSAISKSSAWSAPVVIGPAAIVPEYAAIVTDGKGSFAVVYSGDRSGHGLYSVFSSDNGETWSTTDAFFRTFNNTLFPASLQLYLSSDAMVHAVWSVNDTLGLGRAVYYAAANLYEPVWSVPYLLAEDIDYEAATPSIIQYNDELFVIYHNEFPTTRWMRRSSDQGKTWSTPTRLFDHIGSNGAAALVIDSSNTMHMFFGNRVGDPPIHGMWHSIWLGQQWSEPEAIVSGPQILVGENGEEGFDPSAAQALVIRGNFMYVAWRHDPMAGPLHIWYSYMTLDAPQTPLEVIPTNSAEPVSTQAALTTSTQTPVQVIETQPSGPDSEELASESNPLSNIFLGVIPVLFVIAVVFYVRRRKI